MSEKEDGGPAFPGEHTTGMVDMDPSGIVRQVRDAHQGMSLRDWFAGQVLAGICSHADTCGLTDAPLAKAAYQIADAMLAVRKAKP